MFWEKHQQWYFADTPAEISKNSLDSVPITLVAVQL